MTALSIHRRAWGWGCQPPLQASGMRVQYVTPTDTGPQTGGMLSGGSLGTHYTPPISNSIFRGSRDRCRSVRTGLSRCARDADEATGECFERETKGARLRLACSGRALPVRLLGARPVRLMQ